MDTCIIPADPHMMVYSNLTFGAGGKGKDGQNIAGWGYYEVHTLPYLYTPSVSHQTLSRLSQAGLAQARTGMALTACTHTSRTRA